MNDGDDYFLGVAYHEAGHAVVALALGLRVARIEILQKTIQVPPTSSQPITCLSRTGSLSALAG